MRGDVDKQSFSSNPAGDPARAGGADRGCGGAVADEEDTRVGGGADLVDQLDTADLARGVSLARGDAVRRGSRCSRK